MQSSELVLGCAVHWMQILTCLLNKRKHAVPFCSQRPQYYCWPGCSFWPSVCYESCLKLFTHTVRLTYFVYMHVSASIYSCTACVDSWLQQRSCRQTLMYRTVVRRWYTRSIALLKALLASLPALSLIRVSTIVNMPCIAARQCNSCHPLVGYY